MNNLNDQYFKTRNKHKQSYRKRTLKERIIFFIISMLLIPIIIIYFKSNYESSNILNNSKYFNVKIDTIIKVENFKIMIPKEFEYSTNQDNNLLISISLHNSDFIYFVTKRKIINNDLIKTYKNSLENSKNEFNMKIINNSHNNASIDLKINNDTDGFVKILKVNNEYAYFLHISAPTKIWNYNISKKVIDSFEIF